MFTVLASLEKVKCNNRPRVVYNMRTTFTCPRSPNTFLQETHTIHTKKHSTLFTMSHYMPNIGLGLGCSGADGAHGTAYTVAGGAGLAGGPGCNGGNGGRGYPGYGMQGGAGGAGKSHTVKLYMYKYKSDIPHTFLSAIPFTIHRPIMCYGFVRVSVAI